jgi:hypothetical protein
MNTERVDRELKTDLRGDRFYIISTYSTLSKAIFGIETRYGGFRQVQILSSRDA